MAPGSTIRYQSVSGNAAFGFGLAGSYGTYTYSGADGFNYSGQFATFGLAVGEGASGGYNFGGRSSSLDAFFGNSVGASFTAGFGGVSGSGNESGGSYAPMVGAGEFAGGESTYTVAVGAPTRVGSSCHR